MNERKIEMLELMDKFEGMPDRLLKYMEILLLGKDASPYCFQDTMSYRRLAIALTTHCNLECTWCYRYDPQFKDILDKSMEIETLEKIITNTEGSFRMIHLAGTGEPLFYPHLVKAVSLVRRKTDRVKITTNGTLVTPEAIDKLIAAGLTDIEFSIDTFSTNELKGYKTADLNNVINAVEYVSNNTDLIVQINAVVNSQNIKDLYKIVDQLKNARNISIIHTIPLFYTSQLHDTDCSKTGAEDYKKLLLFLDSEIKKQNLTWELQPTPYGVDIDPIIEMKRCTNICFSCFEDPYIDTDGYLADCGRREFHKLSDASLGFEKAMNSPSAIRYRRDMLNGDYPDYCGELCYLKKKNS